MTRVNKGIRFEYKIRDMYRKMGYYVIRSAGSHGFFDLIAIHPKLKEIKLLQLKTGSRAYLDKIEKVGHIPEIEGQYMVKFELIMHES